MPRAKSDKTDKNKALFLEILKKNMGIINISCQKANIAKSQVYVWRKEDADFEAAILLAQEAPIDMAESVLFYELTQKNLQAAMYVLNKKGHNRGYNEKLDVSGKLEVNLTFTGIEIL